MTKKTAYQTALSLDRDSLLREICTVREEIQTIKNDPLIVNKKMACCAKERRLGTLEKAAKERGVAIKQNKEPEIVPIGVEDLKLDVLHEFARRYCLLCKKHKTTKHSLPCYIRGGLNRMAASPQSVINGHFKQPNEIIKYRDDDRGIICTALALKNKR